MRSPESKLPKVAYADEAFSTPTGPLACPLVSLSSTYSFCFALGRVSLKEFWRIINITVLYAFWIIEVGHKFNALGTTCMFKAGIICGIFIRVSCLF